ncbi:MAG: TasA family protein [Rhodoglobus sp.]|uniref:TasA family protein n=1 Tax=uncultured Salinibacterium sp. TaxID=459274 RepID=UPI0030DCD711|tara:strand:+ start:72823 stop:73425 length:603 start_codon:yes stop_codon:yes gene_type:complete
MNSSTVHGSNRPTSVKGRHKIVKGRHKRIATSPVKALSGGALGIVKAMAILAVAVSVGLVGTGGTYAYLNSSVTASPGSAVSSGTAALTVGDQSLNWTALAPGKSVTGTFTITNTGDVPLVLSPAIAATATGSSTTNPFTISVANGACPASGVPSGTLNSTLAAGATASACLVVTLPANAPSTAQSTNVAITATISGVQP